MREDQQVADAASPSADTPPSRAKRINEWVVVATGILTIAVTVLGIFGYNQHNAKDEAVANADSLQSDLDTANKSIGTLRSGNSKLQQDLSTAQADNQKLQAENQALQHQLQAAGATPSGTPMASAAGAPAVRHQGEVTLADVGDAIDINAPSSDPTWGAGHIKSYEDGAISLNSGNLYFDATSLVLLSGGQAASYQTCSLATGYAHAEGTDPDSLEGTNVCLRTDKGRFATARLIKRSEKSVQLGITTWETAGG